MIIYDVLLNFTHNLTKKKIQKKISNLSKITVRYPLNSQRSQHIYCFSGRGGLQIINMHVTSKPVVI